jgi:hypothetical protein
MIVTRELVRLQKLCEHKALMPQSLRLEWVPQVSRWRSSGDQDRQQSEPVCPRDSWQKRRDGGQKA